MTVTMTISTLYMAAFWCLSAGAVLTATAGRSGWMKLCSGLAVAALIFSTVPKPLTSVDLFCGLAIAMLLGMSVIFIGWKFSSHHSKDGAH